MAGSILLSGEFTPYQKSLVLQENGRALDTESLQPDTPYFFAYPYSSTPALLIKAEVRDENNISSYRLFSYLAINPNTYEFANNDVSIVAYYKDNAFGDEVLRFCDDKSSYALEDGTNVLDQNRTGLKALVSVRLEEDNGKLYAVGLEGDTILKDFFRVQQEKLTARFRSIWNAKIKQSKPKALIDEHFSVVTVRCNDKVPYKTVIADGNKTKTAE